MSSTDTEEFERVSEVVFRALVEHAEWRRAADGPRYFPLAPDGDMDTYFEAVRAKEMEVADFGLSGDASVDGVIDCLIRMWSSQGEHGLVALGLSFKQMAAALRRESIDEEHRINPLCYTMF